MVEVATGGGSEYSPTVPPVCFSEHGGDQEMPGDIRHQRAQDSGIEHQHGARDAGHAAGHHNEELRARQLCEIGPDEQRRLDHADEDVGCGREADRAANAKCALQRP
jgi:hypothetical protein